MSNWHQRLRTVGLMMRPIGGTKILYRCFALSYLALNCQVPKVFADDQSHVVESLHYGNALYQSLTQDPVAALLPLDVAIERKQLQLDDSLYPYLYRADLQFRLGLHQRAEKSFLQLEQMLSQDILSDRLHGIWLRLGALLYADGRFEQAKKILKKGVLLKQGVLPKKGVREDVTKDVTKDVLFLIDDINIRQGLPATTPYAPELSYRYWLEYRGLLSANFTESKERWNTFFQEVIQVKQPSAAFLMMIERATLSYFVLSDKERHVEKHGSIMPIMMQDSMNEHFLSPVIDSYRTKKPISPLLSKFKEATGNMKHVQSLLNIWSNSAQNNNISSTYEAYAQLHQALKIDVEQSRYMQNKTEFNEWFTKKLNQSLSDTQDWFPWVNQQDVRHMQRRLSTLNVIATQLTHWAERFPYLQLVFEQHQAYYTKNAQGIDLTQFQQRLEQAQNRLVVLNKIRADTFPIDTNGVLLSNTLATLQQRISRSKKQLEIIMEASIIDDSSYQEKKRTLQKAQGLLIWQAELQWADQYRDVTKNSKIVSSIIDEVQHTIARIEKGSNQWPGQQFSKRLRQLETQLRRMTAAISAQTQAVHTELEHSAYEYAQTIYTQKIFLHQLVLHNKIVFSQQQHLINSEQLIQDYTLLLQGELKRADRNQAWLGIAEQFFLKGELDPRGYAQAIFYYNKWLDVQNKTPIESQSSPTLHESVLYRVAQSYAFLADQENSIVFLERILQEFPTGQYSDEVQFRLAENAYAKAEYEEAASFYENQILSTPDSNLTLKSTYMLGWCQLKLGEVNSSLNQFLNVIAMTQQEKNKDKNITSLEDDAKRVAVLVMERAGGVEMLGSRFNAPLSELGYQAYTLYFSALRKKELYFKLYESIEYFQQRYPQYSKNMALAENTIDLLDEHSFFDAKRQQQALFLQRYTGSVGLHYALELGDYYRSLRTHPGYVQALEYYSVLQNRWNEVLSASEEGVNFPIALSQLQFRIADTHFDLGHYKLSIPLYEQIAYPSKSDQQEELTAQESSLHDKQRQKAGIAQLTALKKLEATQWNLELQKSRLQFIHYFPQHVTASALRLEAAQDELFKSNFKAVIHLVTPLYTSLLQKQQLSTFDKSTIDLYATALYNDHRYSEAADVYRFGLNHDNRESWSQKFGDALFIVAEKLSDDGEFAKALQPLGVLLTKVPQHPLASAAAFDEGVAYEALGELEKALMSWQGLLQQYPMSSLVGKTSLRLSALLEQQHQYGRAAQALVIYQKSIDPMSKLSTEVDLKVANLYKKAKQPSQSIIYYKRFAHHFNKKSLDVIKKPTETSAWFKAVQNLIDLYNDIDVAKAEFWRRKALTIGLWQFKNLQGDAQQTVLLSVTYFAVQKQNVFESLSLRPPFEQTMPPKQQALTQAIDAYEQLLEFRVSPAYEQAVYGLGTLYLRFAAELTDSERPQGLSDLALEEYEILLEEQAYDFEEKGLAYHEDNVQRLWSGEKNTYILQSLEELQKRLSKYKRQEKLEVIHRYAQ